MIIAATVEIILTIIDNANTHTKLKSKQKYFSKFLLKILK